MNLPQQFPALTNSVFRTCHVFVFPNLARFDDTKQPEDALAVLSACGHPRPPITIQLFRAVDREDRHKDADIWGIACPGGFALKWVPRIATPPAL